MNKRLNFSRHRWVLSTGLFIVLVGLVIYGHFFNPEVKLRECLTSPPRYDGKQIFVDTEARMVGFLPDGFIVQELGQRIRVVGDPQEGSVGDFVRIRAIFHKEGYLELKKLYVAKGRRTKIIVSIVPALLVLLLLFRTYRVDWRHLLLKEKD